MSVRAQSPETALSMQDAAVTNARESGREAAIVDALAQRSQTLLAVGRTSEAAADLDDATPASRQSAGRSRSAVCSNCPSWPPRAISSGTRSGRSGRGSEPRDRNDLSSAATEPVCRSSICGWPRPTSPGDIMPTPRRRWPRASRRSTNSARRCRMKDESRRPTNPGSYLRRRCSCRSRRVIMRARLRMAERARARTLAEARRMPPTLAERRAAGAGA